MSMIPFFPSLRPPISSSICFDVDLPCDDETELRELERDHVAYLKSIQQTGSELMPAGAKVSASGPDPESDDEAANDDSEESDSHDEEEDEDMETRDINNIQSSSTPSSDPSEETT